LNHLTVPVATMASNVSKKTGMRLHAREGVPCAVKASDKLEANATSFF